MSQEGQKYPEDMTCVELALALGGVDLPGIRMTLTLCPDEETKQRVIEAKIAAGFECHCEEEGLEAFHCLKRQHVVVPGLTEDMTMYSEEGEERPDLAGTLPAYITVAIGNAAFAHKACTDSPAFELPAMLMGMPPGFLLHQGTVEEALGLVEGVAATIESVDEFLQGLGLDSGEGEAA